MKTPWETFNPISRVQNQTTHLRMNLYKIIEIVDQGFSRKNNRLASHKQIMGGLIQRAQFLQD